MAYNQSEIAEAIKVAIEHEHANVVSILASHVDKSVCEIETEDGDAAEFSGNGALWVVSVHRLTIDGVEVAEWTRCVCGHYDQGRWCTEEDTEGGDRLPELVELLLDTIGLEDGIPTVDEPDEPDHPTDDSGEYCVYWDTVGGDAGPLKRYASLERAREMCHVFARAFAQRNPCGSSTRMLCGHSLRQLVDGKWVPLDE